MEFDDLSLQAPRSGDTLGHERHTRLPSISVVILGAHLPAHDLMSTLCAGSRLATGRRRLRQCYRIFRKIATFDSSISTVFGPSLYR